MKTKPAGKTYLILSVQKISLSLQKQIIAGTEHDCFDTAADIEFFALGQAGKKAKKLLLDLLKSKNNEIIFCPYGKFQKKFIKTILPQFISGVREDRLDLDFHYSPVFLSE